MADRISRSSNESVKLANRLAKTEQGTRLDLNDNIDSFRAICFVANGVDAFLSGLWSDDNVKMDDFYAKDAILDVNNDPLAVDGKGDYWQCYVYYIDEDPKSWDPRVEIKKSAAYWGKVKKLHKALIPKSSSMFGLIEGTKPDNESEWKIKFLKGGPKRGEWLSGLAIEASEGSYLESPNTPGGSGGGGGTGGGGSGGSGGGGPGVQKPVFPAGVEPAPSVGMYHSKCVNGVLTWEQGQRQGLLDQDEHFLRADEITEGHAGEVTDPITGDTVMYTIDTDKRGIKNWTFDEVKEHLPWFDIERYANTVQSYEAASSGYGGDNGMGFYGRYQFSPYEMIKHGYLPVTPEQVKAAQAKHGKYSDALTKELFLVADWDDPTVQNYISPEVISQLQTFQESGEPNGMVDTWKMAHTEQDNLFAKYTMSRVETYLNECHGDLSDTSELHGMLMGAHLVGFGKDISKSDVNWESREHGLKNYMQDGSSSTDYFGTDMKKYVDGGRAGYLEKYGNPCEDPNSSGEPEESTP